MYLARSKPAIGAIRRLRRAAAVSLILGCAAAVLAACSPGTSAKPSAPGVKAAKPSSQEMAKIPALAANATGTTLTFSDPRTGEPLWTATAKSLSAQTGTAAASAVGTLNGVNGILYQNGKPADKLAAQTVTADQSSRIVTASGGVRLQAIGQDAASVQCDVLVWHADTNEMTGTGHVVFKKGGFTQTGPSFRADTRLRTLVMPASGAAHGAVKAILPAR